MAYFAFSVRNRKPSGRAEYVHNMGHGTPGRGISVGFQDAFMPVPHRRGNHYGYNNPYHQSSAADPDPYLSDLLNSSDLDTAYDRPSGYPEGTSGDHYPSGRFSPIRTPFAKAARTLHDALDHAVKYTEQLEPNFLYETALISPYMDDATRARLWSLKLDFLPVSSAAKDPATTATMEPVQEPAAPSISFSTHEARVLAAVVLWRNAQQPTARDWEELRERGSILSVEDVRLAWRKVRISCSAIGELFEGVKGEQRRIAALVRELASARDALVGIGELWDGGSREGVGLRGGQGQAPEWR